MVIHRAEQISEGNRRKKRRVNVTQWHQYGCNSKNNKSLAKGAMAKVSIAKKCVINTIFVVFHMSRFYIP
jgi:hypothetical protein